MLTEEQIKYNKERFIKLIKSIQRKNCDIEGLINKLETSDFFTAPASTQYHCAYKGGLCFHSLNVYDQLLKLILAEYGEETLPNEEKDLKIINHWPFSHDSLLIVSLLHDFSKINNYETAERNVKDENGTWIKVPFIKTKEAKDRFLYSSHGVNSEYMVGRFIPLSLEESVAIINHMGGQEKGGNGFDSNLSEIYNKYSLALFLHLADMASTFFVEAI